jgi:WD40 repeat protein/DNA-binding SARP family transcriptional activator
LDFRLLGPLEVVGDSGLALQIGTGRQRALLALLLLRANELVTSERLVEELWGGSPPATAQKMLHNQVSALRQVLGRNGRLETQGSAYRLNVARGELDVHRFEELLASARAELDSDPDAAARKLREALGIWRGPALSDLAYEQFAQAEIARLEERRCVAFEVRIEADLAVGRHADLVSELEAAVAEQPLREHLRGLLMLALYRCGRQADALEAYRAARRTLVDQVGVEPGAELRALQDAILAQDPALDPPAAEKLPAPLDGGSPLLAGRERELVELTERVAEAAAGGGSVVLVSGPPGIGKTRLATEVAREALRRRMTVLYVGTSTTAADALAAFRRAEGDGRPALLVLDDAERAGADLIERTTDTAASVSGRSLLLLVLHTGPLPALAEHAAVSVELGPLGDDAIAGIAALYLPEGATPAELHALAAETGGIPLGVHRAAAAWARAEAARVAEASAGRAATERGELRAAEADLSGDLLALRSVDERRRLYRGELDDAPLPAVCPYLGLASFDSAHAEYFFGRERLVAEMIARLVGSPLLAVVGPSGAGKSSAVRAGLLPALANGALPGSQRWVQALMRPGARPLAELERVLPDRNHEAVLAVDQFEELFTVCRDEQERADFLDALVALAADRDRRIQVVVAVRADFYGRCAAHERLARLVGANQVLVGPMRRDELRRAVVEPARSVGLRVELSLTDALIDDTLDEPGGLPLLSAALLEQWRERDGHVMRRAAYERTGGVRGAVGRLAEATYTGLSEPERAAARRVLLRLADAGEEENVFVRRRVPIGELEPARDEHAAAALAALTDSRLVTADEETLEVAHEALLREWPRLRGWLEEDAEGRRLHQHLIHAARDWEDADRDPGELYRGARLASALDWGASHEGDLNELERDFLDASRADAEHEAERQRQANRRLRAVLAGLAVLLALAVVAGIVALNQRGEARDAARVADAQRLGTEALGQERLDEALLLTSAAVELDESPATLGSMLSVLLRYPAAIGVLNYGWPMYGAALSPDGKLIATGDERGAVNVYDAATRRPIGPPYVIEGGLVQNVRFTPDGASIVVSSMDPENREHSGLVDVIDARSLKRTLRVRVPPLPGPPYWVYADVVFPPSGTDLLVRSVHGLGPAGPVGPVYRVDGRTGDVTDRLTVGQHASDFYASWTADRERFFLTSLRDDRTWELDTEPLRLLRSWPVGDVAGAVSPDGRVFALGSEEGRVRLLELDSGRVRPFDGRLDGPVVRMKFTPDGRTLVTSGELGELYTWDVEGGAIAERLAGHTGNIDGLDVATDGRTLLTASTDTRAILWDLVGDRRLDRRFSVQPGFEIPETPRGIAVSRDGRTLALTHSDGTVELVDTRTLEPRASIRATEGPALSVDFSPDGRLLAVTGQSGLVTLWDARSAAPAGELRGMQGPSQALAFSPNGKLLAAAESSAGSGPHQLRVWNVRRRQLTDFRARTAANLIAFSPDGELIAAAASDRGTKILDARTGDLVERLEVGKLAGEGGLSRSVAFSPDGRLLIVGQFNGTGRLFSTQTWRQVGRPLRAHTARITFPEFSPDARTLITASADGTVILWDVATQKQIGGPIRVEANAFVSAALSPDGRRLYAISAGDLFDRGDTSPDEGVSFDMSPAAWKRHACAVAGRAISAGEWEQALPGRPFQAVCSGG